MFNNKRILITGGTGSFGQQFVSDTLKKFKPKEIIVYSRDEMKQWFMLEKFKKYKNLKFTIGDIRDRDRLSECSKGVDILIHAAATKIIPTAEINPEECIKTNINGAQNVIYSAKLNKIKKIVALSTDKASNPINLYGATKLASDKLFTSANLFRGKNRCLFSVVRYGNVMGSRGSVIPLFLKQNENQKYFTITDKNMTRFNITLDDSAKFVLKCLNMMKGGEIFIPKMPSYRITDIIKSINKNMKIKLIGIRPGEKLHEELICESDSMNAIIKKDHFVILPSYRKIKPKNMIFSYNSNNNKNFLSIKKLNSLISNFRKDY